MSELPFTFFLFGKSLIKITFLNYFDFVSLFSYCINTVQRKPGVQHNDVLHWTLRQWSSILSFFPKAADGAWRWTCYPVCWSSCRHWHWWSSSAQASQQPRGFKGVCLLYSKLKKYFLKVHKNEEVVVVRDEWFSHVTPPPPPAPLKDTVFQPDSITTPTVLLVRLVAWSPIFRHER